jgi:hypothetical protein
VAWQADLTLEHEGRVVFRLRAEHGSCALEFPNRHAFQSLQALSRSLARSSSSQVAAGFDAIVPLLPESVDLHLGGILIGRYEPGAPLNGWASTVGLPGGRLTVHKLALARAWLR